MYAPDLYLTTVDDISVHFGKKGTKTKLDTNAVNSIRFTSNPTLFSDIPNVFTANDVVEADCNTATITLRHKNAAIGDEVPQYGALGNQWEDFELRRGTNVITAAWSDWVNTSYKPTLRIIYNEVFI